MGKTYKDIKKVKPEIYISNKKVKHYIDKEDVIKYICAQCGSTVKSAEDYPKCPHCGGELIPN
jgi:rubrerythrin